MHSDRMRATAQAIREYPQNFYMEDFFRSKDGGSAMSVEAATTALESDSDAESIKLAREYLRDFIRNEDLESDVCGTTGCIAGFAVWLFGRDRLLHRSQWSEKGRRVLELTKTQAEELFLMEAQNGESLWARAVGRRITPPLGKLELPYVGADSAADVLDALAVGDLEFSTHD